MLLTPDKLHKLKTALPTLPEKEKRKVAELLKQYHSQVTQRLGKDSFLDFIAHVYPGYKVGPHHRKLAKIFEDIVAGKKKRVIVNIAPRHGKLCAHSTPVLTTKGWKTHGELRVGDEVFHPSGLPVRVVALSEDAVATIEVETTRGEVIKCHENHEWLIRDAITRTEKVVETKWFLQNSATGPRAGQPKKLWLGEGRGQRGSRCHYQLPSVQGLEFPEIVLPVDPYVLGVWLGDGKADSQLFCMSAGDMDQVLPAVVNHYPLDRRYVHATTGVHYARLTLPLKYALKRLGLLDNKHIPEQYLRASTAQRLALLAGLVDTDGHVEQGTGRVRIVTCDPALRDGIYDLATTLGFSPYITEQAPVLSSSGVQGRRTTYTVGFQPTRLLPTKIARKQLFLNSLIRRVGIADVRPAAHPEPGRCIQVDSPDGLYLVGKTLIPTHNSEMISYLAPAWFLGKNPHKKVIMASHTADLAVNFGRRVRNLVAADAYKDIFPQVELQADSKSASRWGTNFNGEYFAIGVGGALAGRGADLFIIDDPHALPLDTEVPTPYGFKTIGELKIGDHVYGPDGQPVKVIAKSEVRKDRELYRVTTDDNHEVLCDGGHLWTYHSETNLKNSHLVKTATARELATWSKPNKPYLPRHTAVQYPERVLPIDPYVLGAWLGDGTASVGRITSHPDDMPFMREQFEQAGYTTTTLTDLYNFGVKTLWTHLKGVGLLDNKHIPDVYMTSSVPQRLALVQGLMDTDGNVTVEGECSFNNTNELLARQFRELINSLGVKAKIRVYYDSRPNHLPIYRVNFKLADCCRMPRKRERTYTPTDKRRRSFTVTPTELRADVQCITVDRPDGLFLVGRGYVVTHNSEQEAKQGRPGVFEPAWEWFQSGPVQRLMPGGALIVVMTRWSKMDLTGKIVDHMTKNEDADQWEVVEFPAILNDEPLWPEFWSIEELLAKKASMDVRYWQAQYMQQPTSEEGALLKREWWKIWDKENPPQCEHIIMSLDAAQEKTTRADYNALTTWGVFFNEEVNNYNIILLNSIKQRLEFPELKEMVLKEYKEWQPDSFIVEKKSNGAALYQEMRRMGVPLSEFTPGKGQDKISRVNAVSDLFFSGIVWAPDRRWAQEVIEECNDFPSGSHDDLVDSTTLALMRFRQGGFIKLPSDEPDDVIYFKGSRRDGYY